MTASRGEASIGKIGPSKKWASGRRRSRNMVSGHPPGRWVKHLVGHLVDLVQIRSLLAVNLDVDKKP